MVRHRCRQNLWGVPVAFISHFREKKGVPLRSIIRARSSALCDGIGRGIEGMTGSYPSNCGDPSYSMGNFGKKREKERGNGGSPVTGPPIQSLVHFWKRVWIKGTDALGCVTNYTSKEVGRWTAPATCTSQETPSEGEETRELKGEQVVPDQRPLY